MRWARGADGYRRSDSLAAQPHDRGGRGRARPLSRSGGVCRGAARSGRAGARRRMARRATRMPPAISPRRGRSRAPLGPKHCRKRPWRAPARLSAAPSEPAGVRSSRSRAQSRPGRPVLAARSRNGAVSPPRWSWRAGSASRSAWTRPACWRATDGPGPDDGIAQDLFGSSPGFLPRPDRGRLSMSMAGAAREASAAGRVPASCRRCWRCRWFSICCLSPAACGAGSRNRRRAVSTSVSSGSARSSISIRRSVPPSTGSSPRCAAAATRFSSRSRRSIARPGTRPGSRRWTQPR